MAICYGKSSRSLTIQAAWNPCLRSCKAALRPELSGAPGARLSYGADLDLTGRIRTQTARRGAVPRYQRATLTNAKKSNVIAVDFSARKARKAA